MNKDLYKAAVDDIQVSEELMNRLNLNIKNNKKEFALKVRYGIAAACAVIVIFGVVFMQFGRELFSDKKIGRLNPGTEISISQGNIHIYTNKIQGIKSSKILIPEGSVSKEYNIENISKAFGRNPLPAVPKDFKLENNSISITYNPQGKMLFMSALSYSKDINNPSSPTIDMKFNKNALPPRDCLYSSANLKESIFGATKVTIGSATLSDKVNEDGKTEGSYDVYSAQFIYKGIGYDITAKRIDADTFIGLLKSIIKD